MDSVFKCITDSELAKNAKNLFLRQNGAEQARLLRTLRSNCTLRDGSLTLPTYRKPFDLLAEGNESETDGWEAGTIPATGC